jgi:hypothetical protein
MTTLSAPRIIAAHVATLPTLPGWQQVPVYEGAALRRDDVREWCTVGHVAGTDDATVSFEPGPTSQGQTRETGTITSQIVVAAADAATARARVFDLVAAWAAWLSTDRTLHIGDEPQLLTGSDLRLAADVALATTRAGATAGAVVTITYTAITYG